MLSEKEEDNFFQQLIDKNELASLPARYDRRAKELAAEGRVSID
jgi:hypothetical protein